MSTVKIGHASIDENGKASGGQAGDQTGREVCVRDWYAGGWNVLLRPRSAAVAEKMAKFCEAVCANDKVGYNQARRNTLRRAALMAGWDGSKIAAECETDCSAFMTVCAEAAGVNLQNCYYGGNAPTTWTMRGAFSSTGAFDVLTDSKYLVSDAYLKRGDVLVRESGHTCMALSNGANAAQDAPAAAASGSVLKKTYVVQSGDTLWDISRQFGVTVLAITAENGIAETGFIYPGQRLIIP